MYRSVALRRSSHRGGRRALREAHRSLSAFHFPYVRSRKLDVAARFAPMRVVPPQMRKMIRDNHLKNMEADSVEATEQAERQKKRANARNSPRARSRSLTVATSPGSAPGSPGSPVPGGSPAAGGGDKGDGELHDDHFSPWHHEEQTKRFRDARPSSSRGSADSRGPPAPASPQPGGRAGRKKLASTSRQRVTQTHKAIEGGR